MMHEKYEQLNNRIKEEEEEKEEKSTEIKENNIWFQENEISCIFI